jgi:SecD/SecF fusion protein
VDIVEERTVGPSLGAASIRAGTISVIIGLVLVAVFMVLYYQTAGLIANLALLLNIIFIFGILAGFGATLTLPGIAGIVLTIGMAVDANVLIFDRIREELNSGKT